MLTSPWSSLDFPFAEFHVSNVHQYSFCFNWNYILILHVTEHIRSSTSTSLYCETLQKTPFPLDILIFLKALTVLTASSFRSIIFKAFHLATSITSTQPYLSSGRRYNPKFLSPHAMVTSWSSLGMVGQNPLLLAAMLFFFVLLSLVGPSSAHMVMSEPPPINYVSNPNYIVSKADFDYSAPLTPTGSNYPCRGHLKDLDTPQGLPVRTYKQGSTYNVV